MNDESRERGPRKVGAGRIEAREHRRNLRLGSLLAGTTGTRVTIGPVNRKPLIPLIDNSARGSRRGRNRHRQTMTGGRDNWSIK